MVSEYAPKRTDVSMDEWGAMKGLSRTTVKKRIADGTIKAFRIGRLVRIPLDQDVGTPIKTAEAPGGKDRI